jgi:hypothetical protein
MGPHMSNGRCLAGRVGGRHRRGPAHFASGTAALEPMPDLRGDIEFAAGESSGPSDGFAGTAVPRSFGLEQPQGALGTHGCPGSHDPPVSFAERLRRSHGPMFSPPAAPWPSSPRLGG